MSGDEATKSLSLEDRKSARDEERSKKWDAMEKLVLELEDRFEGEKGARGSEFGIILPASKAQVDDGPIVVSRPESVVFKKFQNSEATQMDAQHLSLACLLYPGQEPFKEITTRRPVLLTRCATAIAKLAGLELKAESGKS